MSNNYPNRRPQGRTYGTAGKGIGSAAGQQKFGSRAKTGAFGEQRFGEIASQYKLGEDYSIYYSLRIPTPPGSKPVQSDVDVAIANGRKLILVDVKMWKGGVHWWSLGGRAMANLTPQHDKALSKNMQMALERYRAVLKGVEVEALVVFVPAGDRGSLPASVFFLRWPGGIRSKLIGSGVRHIKRFLGKADPEGVDARVQSVLGSMVKH